VGKHRLDVNEGELHCRGLWRGSLLERKPLRLGCSLVLSLSPSAAQAQSPIITALSPAHAPAPSLGRTIRARRGFARLVGDGAAQQRCALSPEVVGGAGPRDRLAGACKTRSRSPGWVCASSSSRPRSRFFFTKQDDRRERRESESHQHITSHFPGSLKRKADLQGGFCHVTDLGARASIPSDRWLGMHGPSD
jgi:hypothetical protein